MDNVISNFIFHTWLHYHINFIAASLSCNILFKDLFISLEEGTLSTVGLLSKWLQKSGLGQVEALNQELHLGCVLLFPRHISREMG